MSLIAVISLALGLGGHAGAEPLSISPMEVTVASVDEQVTSDTVNDFLPEDSNLTDCLGLLEKPGCGSEDRGGWRQTAVFAAIVLGLGLIFFNVVRGVRKNREHLGDGTPDPHS